MTLVTFSASIAAGSYDESFVVSSVRQAFSKAAWFPKDTPEYKLIARYLVDEPPIALALAATLLDMRMGNHDHTLASLTAQASAILQLWKHGCLEPPPEVEALNSHLESAKEEINSFRAEARNAIDRFEEVRSEFNH